MSENEEKREFRMLVSELGAILNKEVKPTTREAIEKDRELNQTIRHRAIQVRQHKYFKNLIIKDKTHEEFLDVWEALEYFVDKWAFPYRVLSDMEWKEEDADLWGIAKVFYNDTKII